MLIVVLHSGKVENASRLLFKTDVGRQSKNLHPRDCEKRLGPFELHSRYCKKTSILRIEHVFGDPVREADPTWALTRGESMYQ